MSKKIDPDISVLKACVKALGKSSSRESIHANIAYLLDRFIVNPVKTEDLKERKRK